MSCCIIHLGLSLAPNLCNFSVNSYFGSGVAHILTQFSFLIVE